MVKLLEGPRIGQDIRRTFKQIRLKTTDAEAKDQLPNADEPDAKRQKGLDTAQEIFGKIPVSQEED